MHTLSTLFFQLVDMVIHLDAHLNQGVVSLGPWMYVVLFAIVFCETGLVIMPFLPGDSLLFALGALAASETSVLSYPILAVTLIAAALMGDITNYSIGKFIGPKVFSGAGSKWMNRKHLNRTQEFYERHGGKTIILARFLPIVRTFAPFVAGVGQMRYRRFISFSVVGALAWVFSFLSLGFIFGNLPSIKQNFHYVIIAILFISTAPVILEYFRSRRAPQTGESDA